MNDITFQYSVLFILTTLTALFAYNTNTANKGHKKRDDEILENQRKRDEANTFVLKQIERTIEKHEDALINNSEINNKLANVISKADFRIEKFELITNLKIDNINKDIKEMKVDIKSLRANVVDIYNDVNEIQTGCLVEHGTKSKINITNINGNSNKNLQDINTNNLEANFSD